METAERHALIEQCAQVARAVQRCTCPPTPGAVRTTHERWCPWAIASAIRALKEARDA